MKLAQLKEELTARVSTRTGLKAVLQRRLHGLLVQAAHEATFARRAEEAEAEAEADDEPAAAAPHAKRVRRGIGS